MIRRGVRRAPIDAAGDGRGDRAARQSVLLRRRAGARDGADAAGARRRRPVSAPRAIAAAIRRAPERAATSAPAERLAGGRRSRPFPGPAHRLPLAASPAAQRGDLRATPTVLSETLGLPVGRSPSRACPTPTRPRRRRHTSWQLAGLPSGPAAAPAMPALGRLPERPLPCPPPRPRPHLRCPRRRLPAPAPGEPSPPPRTYEFQPGVVPELHAAHARLFDPHACKRDFPILRERVHGRPLVWLDNAATTQKPQAVIDRALVLLRARELQRPPRRAHARRARDRRLRGARATRCGASSTRRRRKEIVFVRGATEGDQPRRAELGPAQRRPGRRDRHHLARAPREHRPLAAALRREGRAAPRRAGRRPRPGHPRGVRAAARARRRASCRSPRSRTRSAPSCRCARWSRWRTATARVVLVDGAQAVSHMPVDVQALDCDFYVFSGHKVFAPTGIGVVFGKARRARSDAALAGRRQHDRRRDLREDDLPAAALRASRRGPAASPTPSGSAPPSTT